MRFILPAWVDIGTFQILPASNQAWESRECCLAVQLLIILRRLKCFVLDPHRWHVRLKKLIQVCVHAWKELEIHKVPQPNIKWIMNQEAVQDRQHHKESFQKMFEELKEVFSSDDDVKSLRDFLKLDGHSINHSIATVPTMYSESTFVTNAEPEKFTRLMKADSFTEACADLTRKMLDHFHTARKEEFSLDNWLDMSLAVFQAICWFPTLTSFSDIKQINQRKRMRSWIECMMDSTFETPEKKQKHAKVKGALWQECREAGEASIKQELPVKLKQLGVFSSFAKHFFQKSETLFEACEALNWGLWGSVRPPRGLIHNCFANRFCK